jgi:hypothetical protein
MDKWLKIRWEDGGPSSDLWGSGRTSQNDGIWEKDRPLRRERASGGKAFPAWRPPSWGGLRAETTLSCLAPSLAPCLQHMDVEGSCLDRKSHWDKDLGKRWRAKNMKQIHTTSPGLQPWTPNPEPFSLEETPTSNPLQVVEPCLASLRPWVQIPVPPRMRKKERKMLRGLICVCLLCDFTNIHFFWWYWGLNSGPPLSPTSSTFHFSLFIR